MVMRLRDTVQARVREARCKKVVPEENGELADFKWRNLCAKIILWALRWYCRYRIDHRELEITAERAVTVDHTTRGLIAIEPRSRRRSQLKDISLISKVIIKA